MYYQKTKYPTFQPLGLYMPGGNRKTDDPSKRLPGRVEKNGVTYTIDHTSPTGFVKK